jgi:hypothetical protein
MKAPWSAIYQCPKCKATNAVANREDQETVASYAECLGCRREVGAEYRTFAYVGYLWVEDGVYLGLPDRHPDSGRKNLYCGEGNYWIMRCNICRGIETGYDGELPGIDWHKRCQTGMVQPPNKKPFRAHLVNVRRWHSALGYLWLEDDREAYL